MSTNDPDPIMRALEELESILSAMESELDVLRLQLKPQPPPPQPPPATNRA